MTNSQNDIFSNRHHTHALWLGIFFPLITIGLLGVNVVHAEVCEKPVCKRKEIYHKGICHRSTGYPRYIRSQSKAVCYSGWELVFSRGICVKTRCNGVTLQPLKPRPKDVGSKDVGSKDVGSKDVGTRPVEVNEKPACKPKETYRDGICHRSTGYPTYIKTQTRAVCDSGWQLDAGRGVCVR